MPPIQNMQERQRGVLPHRGLAGRVDQVPGRSQIGVGDVEGVVEVRQGGEVEGAVTVLVRAVDGGVFGDVLGGHVPVEAGF